MKILYVILILLGGGLVGFMANKLTTIYGPILFGIGVGLMVYSIYNLCRK